jgi:hypothetical protein
MRFRILRLKLSYICQELFKRKNYYEFFYKQEAQAREFQIRASV